MNVLTDVLDRRIQLLKRAIKQAEKETSFPEGRLRISKTEGRVRYYEVNEKSDTNGIYLHKKDQLPRVKQLAQKDYNRQFLKMAGAELQRLERFIELYQKQQAETAYSGDFSRRSRSDFALMTLFRRSASTLKISFSDLTCL